MSRKARAGKGPNGSCRCIIDCESNKQCEDDAPFDWTDMDRQVGHVEWPSPEVTLINIEISFCPKTRGISGNVIRDNRLAGRQQVLCDEVVRLGSLACASAVPQRIISGTVIAFKHECKVVRVRIKRGREPEIHSSAGRYEVAIVDDGRTVGRIGKVFELLAPRTVGNRFLKSGWPWFCTGCLFRAGRGVGRQRAALSLRC